MGISLTLHSKHADVSRDNVVASPRNQHNIQSANELFLNDQQQSFNVIEIRKPEQQINVINQNVEKIETGVEENRTPIQHLAFLKVHKTASSTAQNIFLRFGDERNLTFVLAHTKGESGWLNVISYTNSITSDNIVPPPQGGHFDLLCCHVIYNRNDFEAVLPRDTAYIGIVREPISRFQSSIKYFSPNFILKLPGNNPMSIYSKSPLAFEPENPRDSQTNNRMALEFGFPAQLFPGKELNGSQSEIDTYLSKLDTEFKFIIISEKFDESMVLMKRLLNWHTRDVLYLDKNVGSKMTNKRKLLQHEDHDKIRNFLYLDTAIYTFALNRFNRQAAEAGTDFVNEVKDFKSIREKVKLFCANSKATPMLIQSSKWYGEFRVTTNDCKLYSKHEKDLIQKQRLRMYGVLEN